MASTGGEGDVQGHNLVVKTGRNPSEWKKNTAKRKRNSGEEYESSVTRKVVKKKEIGAPCRDGCFEKMGMNNIKAIHESFWGLGDFNLQNAFIQKFCVKGVVKRRRVRVRGDAPPRRSCTRSYSFLCGDNVIPVCATAFRSVLSISTKRLHTAVESVTPTGTPRVDRRGKHVPKHAMPASRKNLVEQHVKSFPTVSSHYTRAKSPLMRYLDTDMTLQKMFFLYKEWLFDTNEDEEPVKFSYYKKVVRGYHLGFKPPNTDTCSKCDRYEVSKKDASTEEEAENDWSTDTASEDGMAPCTTKPSSMESRMEEPLETPLADNDKVMIGDGDHDHSEVLTEDQLQVIPASKLDSIPGDNEEWETLTVSPKLDNSHDHEEGETPPTLKLDNHYDKDEKTEILPVTLNIDNGHNDAEEAPLTSPKIDDLHDNEEKEESLCSFSVNGRNRNSSEIKEVDHLHDQEDKLAQELLQLSGSSSSLINNNKQDNTEEEEIEEDEEKCKNHPLEDAHIEAIQEYIQKAIQVAQDKDPDLDRSSHFATSLSKVLELYTDLLKNRKSEEQCFTYFRPAKLSPPSHCSEDEIFFRDSGQHSTEKSSLQELQQVSDQKQDTVNNASGNQQTIGHDTESTTRSKGINCKIKEEKKEYIDEYCMSIKEEPLFDEHEYLDSIETIQEQIKEEVSSDFMQDPLFQKVGHECNINDVDENNSSSFQDFESCVEDLPGGPTSY